MPLHDVGYRPWCGERRGPLSAILVIAATGIRLAWSSRWLRRAVFFAWSPAILFAGSFFAFEQAVDEGRLGAMRTSARMGRNLDGIGVLGAVIADALGDTVDPAERHGGPEAEVYRTRRAVWSRLLLLFMRAPQAILLAIVVGLVAPTLVSRDLRARAWLIYFTRPVGKFEYVAGKLLILALLVAAITMLPGIVLWGMGVAVSPSVWVALATWDLPLRIVAASVALAVPTVLLALAFSSLTAESRIASFAWFATWIACWVAHTSLATADLIARPGGGDLAVAVDDGPEDDSGGMGVGEGNRGGRGRGPSGRPGAGVDRAMRGARESGLALDLRRVRWLARATGLDAAVDRWAWISPYHALGVVQAWIFGIERRPEVVLPPVVSLTVVSLLAVFVLWWRVDAPARA